MPVASYYSEYVCYLSEISHYYHCRANRGHVENWIKWSFDVFSSQVNWTCEARGAGEEEPSESIFELPFIWSNSMNARSSYFKHRQILQRHAHDNALSDGWWWRSSGKLSHICALHMYWLHNSQLIVALHFFFLSGSFVCIAVNQQGTQLLFVFVSRQTDKPGNMRSGFWNQKNTVTVVAI